MSQQLIRILLKAYDYRLLDQAIKSIIATVTESGSRIRGPIPLPRHDEKFTVLRSPHIFKKARDQWEIRTSKRLLDVVDCTPQTTEALMKLNLASGVSVEIKCEVM